MDKKRRLCIISPLDNSTHIESDTMFFLSIKQCIDLKTGKTVVIDFDFAE